MELADFLQRAAARPWRWGEHDCTLFAADWVAVRHGRDPAREWRDSYSTAIGCERALRRAGGLEVVWAVALDEIGLSPTRTPFAGDVGLVIRRASDLEWRPTGAILADGGWASLTPGGLLIADAPLVKAWRV